MKNALIIFVKNPELGKVKTRLALKIGDEKALEVYKLLLLKIHSESQKTLTDVLVYYSDSIVENDIWQGKNILKKLQATSPDLGIRMQKACKEAFATGYDNVLLVGSDIYDLNAAIIQQGFEYLESKEIVLGPSLDGGFYAVGFPRVLTKQHTNLLNDVFLNKKWSHNAVYQDTVNVLEEQKINFEILPKLRDIDNVDDLLGYPELIFGAKITW